MCSSTPQRNVWFVNVERTHRDSVEWFRDLIEMQAHKNLRGNRDSGKGRTPTYESSMAYENGKIVNGAQTSNDEKRAREIEEWRACETEACVRERHA
jgi:hypothetical protein